MKLRVMLKTTGIAAFAAGVSLASASKAMAGDWYAGAGVSSSKNAYDAADYERPGVTNTQNDRSPGYRVLGGYRFTPKFAVEGGYGDIGAFKYKYGSTTAMGNARDATKISAWTLAGVGQYYLSSAFSLLGKLGLANVEYRDTLTYDNTALNGPGMAQYAPLGTTMTSRETSKISSKLYYGFGLQYDLTKSIGLRGLYEDYGSQGSASPTGLGTGRGRVTQFSTDIVFRF